MGLITLIFILIFTLLYLSKSLEKKPALLTQAVDKISDHIDQVALWGVIYGIVAALLTLITYSGGGMLVRFIANVMIVVMTLPLVFDKLAEKFHEKINPAIGQEAKNLVGWIAKQEKYIGYAGVVFTLLLFAVIFR